MEKGYEGLLTAIFGELTMGIYPYILEEDGREVSLPEALNEALDKLPLSKTRNQPDPWPMKKRVLELRFGIPEDEPKTLRQTANDLGVKSREQIRELQNKALRNLRHPTHSRRLRQFIIPSPRSLAELRERLGRLEEVLEQKERTIEYLLEGKERLLHGKPPLTPEQQRIGQESLWKAFEMPTEKPVGLYRVRYALLRGKVKTVSDLRERMERGDIDHIAGIGEKGVQICTRALELIDQQAQSE